MDWNLDSKQFSSHASTQTGSEICKVALQVRPVWVSPPLHCVSRVCIAWDVSQVSHLSPWLWMLLSSKTAGRNAVIIMPALKKLNFFFPLVLLDLCFAVLEELCIYYDNFCVWAVPAFFPNMHKSQAMVAWHSSSLFLISGPHQSHQKMALSYFRHISDNGSSFWYTNSSDFHRILINVHVFVPFAFLQASTFWDNQKQSSHFPFFWSLLFVLQFLIIKNNIIKKRQNHQLHITLGVCTD